MRLFRGTKYWNCQLAGFFGAFCTVAAAVCPMTQQRFTAPGDSVGDASRSYIINGFSFLTAEDKATRLSACLLITVMCGALWAVMQLRLRALAWWTLAQVAAASVVAYCGINNLRFYHDFKKAVLIPVYFQTEPIEALAWGWHLLFLGPLFFAVAAMLAREPGESERAELFAQTRPDETTPQ